MPITPELAQYVSQARSAGIADDAIRAELLKAGWSSLDVDAVLPPPRPMPPQPVLQTPFQEGPVSEAKAPKNETIPPPIKKSRIPFITTVVTLLLIGGGVYYFLPHIVTYADKLLGTSEPMAPIEEVSDDIKPRGTDRILTDTSGWQTYRNEEYGFLFGYPANFIIGDSSDSTSSTEIQVLVTRFDQNGELIMDDRVFVMKNLNWDSEEKKISDVIDSLHQKQPLLDYREQQVNGYTVARFHRMTLVGEERFEYAVISDGFHNVVLHFNPIAAGNQDFIEQFISAFKFIPEATSTIPY